MMLNLIFFLYCILCIILLLYKGKTPGNPLTVFGPYL